MRPYLEKNLHKIKGWWSAQCAGTEFKPQYCKQNKTKQNKNNPQKTKNQKTTKPQYNIEGNRRQSECIYVLEPSLHHLLRVFPSLPNANFSDFRN
jgi:hypothetical protein